MSLVMRKSAFCICENKDSDQLGSNCAADQRLCFRYTDSTIPLLPKSQISSLQPSSVAVQPGLCRTWSETLKTGFLTMRLIIELHQEEKPALNTYAKNKGADWLHDCAGWSVLISIISSFDN